MGSYQALPVSEDKEDVGDIWIQCQLLSSKGHVVAPTLVLIFLWCDRMPQCYGISGDTANRNKAAPMLDIGSPVSDGTFFIMSDTILTILACIELLAVIGCIVHASIPEFKKRRNGKT